MSLGCSVFLSLSPPLVLLLCCFLGHSSSPFSLPHPPLALFPSYIIMTFPDFRFGEAGSVLFLAIILTVSIIITTVNNNIYNYGYKYRHKKKHKLLQQISNHILQKKKKIQKQKKKKTEVPKKNWLQLSNALLRILRVPKLALLNLLRVLLQLPILLFNLSKWRKKKNHPIEILRILRVSKLQKKFVLQFRILLRLPILLLNPMLSVLLLLLRVR